MPCARWAKVAVHDLTDLFCLSSSWPIALPTLDSYVCNAQVKGLESEVRYQLTEARIVLRRRNVIPLMVGCAVLSHLGRQPP